MNLLSTVALEDFLPTVHKNLDVCKLLFTDENMLKCRQKDLYNIYLYLKKDGTVNHLPQDNLNFILKKFAKEEEKAKNKAKEEAQKKKER